MVRVNTRISKKMNDWLESVTEETGVPKTTQIMLALETYSQQQRAMDMMSGYGDLVDKLEKIEKTLEESKKSAAD